MIYLASQVNSATSMKLGGRDTEIRSTVTPALVAWLTARKEALGEMFARLIESHEIAHEVRHFTFEVPDVGELPYRPGQFVSLYSFRGEKSPEHIRLRLPQAGIVSELCLNRVQDGLLSPFLFSLQPGDMLPMKGPPRG